MKFSLVAQEGTKNVTVFHGGELYTAHEDHPNFDAIVEGVLADDETVVDLFDVSVAAATKFERVSDTITTANGRLYQDGVELDDALSAQIVRFLKDGVDDWKPLVAFLENVQANTNEHSREHLYQWLKSVEETDRQFTITDKGFIVGYKGVQKNQDGSYQSSFTGKAIVDGEVVEGHIPNAKGSVIEMPRDEVTFDPAVGCSYGLHVGTYAYAEGFANGGLLEVHVNPRDVVSVPTDSSAQKMRVCRYLVADVIDAPHTVAVVRDYTENEDWDGWGDFEDEGDELCECGEEFAEDCDCADPEFFPEADSDDPDSGVKQDGATFGTFPVADAEAVLTGQNAAADAQNAASLVGVTFKDTDSRRAGRTFTVTAVEGDFAIGTSKPLNITRKIRLDRLDSRKYKKV